MDTKSSSQERRKKWKRKQLLGESVMSDIIGEWHTVSRPWSIYFDPKSERCLVSSFGWAPDIGVEGRRFEKFLPNEVIKELLFCPI